MATITSEQAKIVSGFQRNSGRQQLSKFLGWDSFDEEEERLKGIHLDFLYDNLMHCVQKGFPWPHVCTFVKLADEMVEESKGKTLADAIRLYRTKCQTCLHCVSDTTMKAFTEYFFTSFMQHYKLFQYVFTQDQDKLFTHLEVNVDTPIPPMPFSESKDVTTWDYEQKIKEIELQAEEMKQDREQEQKSSLEETVNRMQEVEEKLKELEMPLEKERLMDLIHEVACAHVSSASVAIQASIRDTQQDLLVMLDKTSVPRPQALGAPPRYKTKTPLGGNSNTKREKSSRSRSALKK